MKILTSSYGLDLSGVPTFTLTMYRELEARGHDVTVYSPLGGKLEREMKVVKEPLLGSHPDVVLAQNKICAESLHAAFPNVPLVFYSHSIWVEMEQPPSFTADWYIAINEAVRRNLQVRGVPTKKISIVRDFVDTKRFRSTSPINETLKNVLFISNYKKWNNFKLVDAACTKLGVALTCVGSPYGRSDKIEEAINKADLVISWGRGVLEGMSCERAVVSFEKMMGDGYISSDNYLQTRRDNFSGYLSGCDITTVDAFCGELSKYNYGSGKTNRDLVEKHHNVTSGIDQILEIINKV